MTELIQQNQWGDLQAIIDKYDLNPDQAESLHTAANVPTQYSNRDDLIANWLEKNGIIGQVAEDIEEQ